MKRILSVILSLALLASLLIVPMSVSAVTAAEKEAAFNAVVDAVKNLELDLNNVSTIEYANPTASAGGSDNSGKITLSDVSAVADKAILGDKKVQINGDNKVTDAKGGLVKDHLHAINYQPISNVYVHLYKVGYFVIYVKTARPFKLSLGAANGQTQNINFLNGENAIDVPATGDGYTPVVINVQSGIDWTKSVLNGNNAKRLYAAEYVFSKLYASVQEMTEGDNAITAEDGITFGSAFYVPVDETVRDFRYNVTTFRNPASGDVQYRFTELSAEMIAAAEAIDNTHGNYTADSFATLQNAIKTAKEVFLDDGGNAVDLFKAEVNNLYKLEEVCRPTSFGGDMNGLTYANASEITINGKPLSDKQKEYFGDCLVKVDSTTNSTNVVRLTDKTTTGAVPGMGQLVKKYKDYKNLYLAVANTGDVYKDTQFTSYNEYNTAVNYITRQDSSYNRQLILKNGCNLISLYDLIVNVDDKKVTEDGNTVTYYIRDNNVLYYSDYMLKYDTSQYKTYYDGFNVLNFVSKTLAEGTSLYIGSLMGEVAFDTTDLEEVTTKAQVIDYYNTNIAGKDYIGTEDIEETLDIIGVPPVIKIEGNKLSNTETDTYCGSVKVTVTDPNGDLRYVKVNSDNRLEEFKKGTVELTDAGVYSIAAGDAKNNDTDELSFTIADHELVYSAEGAVITETCKNCAHEETLTLKVKSDNIAYDGTDKSDLIKAEKSAGFVGTAGTITFKQNDKPITKVEDIGEYTAEVTVGGKTAVLKFTVNKPNDPAYEYPGDKEGVAGEQLSSIELPEKFDWNDGNEKIKFGVNLYDAIYDPQNENYQVQNIKIQVTGTDTTAPTGTITIKQTVWDKITEVLFGWFIDAKETVTITGSDTGSGVKAIYYYVTDTEVDTAKITDWKEYKDPFKIEKEGNNVVYAKVVDVAEKESIINTTGIVLDTKNPESTIDLDTYYGALNFTVNEANLDSVKVKDADSTSDPVDVPVKDGVYTVAEPGEKVITITDKAGHKAEYKVNIIEIKGFDPTKDEAININVDLDENNVDLADMEKIAKKIDEDSETVTYFNIDVKKVIGDSDVTTTSTVYQIPVEFNFDGKLNIRVLHNHGGTVKVLEALTSMPTSTDDYKTGTFFADKENNILYIYTKEFSTFAVAFHVHSVKHIDAVAATATADGNIEYWYCEGCDTCFSDAIATKEITKESTVVKYVNNENGNNNTGSGSNTSGSNTSGSNTSGGSTDTGNANAGTTLPGGISPGTGQTAMAAVLFAILLGALAVMGISVVKSRKAKSK